jgi:hypothetical protein
MTTKAILIDNTKQLDPNLLLVSSSALSDVLDATLVPFPSGLQTGPAKPRGGNLVQSSAEVLNSWKEIASFLNRGVRTVQRWERELQLPVHRIGKGNRSPVFAFGAEIKLWLHSNKDRVSTELHPEPQLQMAATRMPTNTRLKASWLRCQELTGELEKLVQQHQLHILRLAQNLQNASCFAGGAAVS